MTPRIENCPEKKLIGKHATMSLTNYKIGDLWRSFLPRQKEIKNSRSNNLISLTLYDPTYFTNFNPTHDFEKWVAVEVENFNNTPREMETFVLQHGLYAIFDYKGLSTDRTIFHYIFETWLPSSEYAIDTRPHMEVLGENYRNNDPTSEEEIWIPISPK